MAQGNYTSGQTALLVDDVTTILKQSNAEYYKTGVDFFLPHKQTIAAYAAAYTGTYYDKMVASAAFSTAVDAMANGSLYEETLPADCSDDGIQSLVLKYSTNSPVPEADITNSTDETTWDFAATNTTIAYWRQEGRKLRVYLPTAYVTTAKWSASYKRLPTYPQLTGDTLDIPAEDIDTYIALYKANVIIP